MREPYLPPELTRVASIKDLTLGGAGSNVVDVCIQVGNITQVGIGIFTAGPCS